MYASGIIAEIGDISAFRSADALAKYAGLTWRHHDSGDFRSDDTYVTKVGNIYLRYFLVEAANSVRRHVPEYGEYYAKKFAEVTKHQHKRALALTSRNIKISSNHLLTYYQNAHFPRSITAIIP